LRIPRNVIASIDDVAKRLTQNFSKLGCPPTARALPLTVGPRHIPPQLCNEPTSARIVQQYCSASLTVSE